MKEPEYNFLDRMAHRLAFRSGFAQQILCDLEMQFYRKDILQQNAQNPIFVTALARAGTTIVLEILAKHPQVVTQTYRDMPFVLSPIIWRKLSKKFQTDIAKRERTHSDGVMVDADSPEAFEEVLWLKECPEMFTDSGIKVWPEDASQVGAALTDLMRRIMVSQHDHGSTALRYVSKNNANIARIPTLRQAFPQARFLAPLRAPIDHAISLHRQHLHYLDIHSTSNFTQSYMKDIGHFEFGALHRPILFKGMTSVIKSYATTDLNYWIGYWLCAYRHLASLSGIYFVDMGKFTQKPNLGSILEKLDLSFDQATSDAAVKLLHPIKHYDRPDSVSVDLNDEADQLYRKLLSRSDWVLPS